MNSSSSRMMGRDITGQMISNSNINNNGSQIQHNQQQSQVSIDRASVIAPMNVAAN